MFTSNYNSLIPHMKAIVPLSQGTNFTLMMEHDLKTELNQNNSNGGTAKDYSIHVRQNQPCQGGELRKYVETHGDECDKPESHKPMDLFHPFPKGRPVMVGNAFRVDKKYGDIIKFLFSKDSPYREGVGVDPILLKDNKGNFIGVILQRTDQIDPTVMVNLLQFKNTLVYNGFAEVSILMEYGCSIPEALALWMLGGSSNHSLLQTFAGTYTYYFAEKFSVAKFLEGRPNKLSNGSFYNRHDYDRKRVQDLFMEDDKDLAFIWTREMRPFVSSNRYTWKGNFLKDVLPEALNILRSKYAEQKLAETPVKSQKVA